MDSNDILCFTVFGPACPMAQYGDIGTFIILPALVWWFTMIWCIVSVCRGVIWLYRCCVGIWDGR